MELKIHVYCPECDGYGKTEHTTGGWTSAGPWMNYAVSRCDHCAGIGEVIHFEDSYDTLAEARLDYPLANHIEIDAGEEA